MKLLPKVLELSHTLENPQVPTKTVLLPRTAAINGASIDHLRALLSTGEAQGMQYTIIGLSNPPVQLYTGYLTDMRFVGAGDGLLMPVPEFLPDDLCSSNWYALYVLARGFNARDFFDRWSERLINKSPWFPSADMIRGRLSL